MNATAALSTVELTTWIIAIAIVTAIALREFGKEGVTTGREHDALPEAHGAATSSNDAGRTASCATCPWEIEVVERSVEDAVRGPHQLRVRVARPIAPKRPLPPLAASARVA